MKNKKIYLAAALAALLGSCTQVGGPTGPNNPGKPDKPEEETEHYDPYQQDQGIGDETSDTNMEVEEEPEDEVILEETAPSKITDLEADGISYDQTNKIFNITKAGEFTFKGQFEGRILVNAGDDDDVKITLNGFAIKSKEDSPIKCLNANELQVSLKKGNKNYIYDYRSLKVEDNDEQGNGAITADCDLCLQA